MMKRRLNERDKRLILQTSMFYLQYRRLDTFSKLKKVLDDVEKINLDDAQRFISAYLAYIAVKTVNRAINLALRDQWVKREFSSEIDDDLWGTLDVSRTISVYPFYYASLHPNLKVVEASFLSWIAERVEQLARERLSYSQLEPFSFYEDMRRELSELREKRTRLLPRPVRSWINESSPEWLKHSYYSYLVARRSRVGLKPRSGEVSHGFSEERIGVKIILSKLYELYVYLIVMRSLEEMGFRIWGEEGDIRGKKDGEEVHILFNVSPNKYDPIRDIIQKVDELREEVKAGITGRPDLSIVRDAGMGGKLIIIECKYSTDPGYITEGRFKAMAYTYEFGSDITLLVFPSLHKRKAREAEEEGTIRIYDKMREHGGWLDLKLRDGRTLYMVSLDPLDDMRESVNKLKQLINAEFNF